MKRLTGNVQVRAGFRGQLVLQVEEQDVGVHSHRDDVPDTKFDRTYWRDAVVEDLCAVTLKGEVK